jgi:hypothetical protein
MKGREIINHAVRAKMPDREQVKQNILQTAHKKQTKMRPLYKRSAITLATAAALVFCIIFGNMLMNPQVSNFFAVSAYAMELQDDGSITLREINIHTNDKLRGFSDGEYTFLNIGLRYSGENLKMVEFSVNGGFLAQQYILDEHSREVPMIVSDNAIHLYGFDFERLGSNVVFENYTMPDNLLMFLGFSGEIDDLPETATLYAVATFNDGTTQEETIVIEIRDRVTSMIVNNPAGLSDWRNDPWRSIVLEDCILIPESVKIIGEADEYGVVYEFDAAIEAAPQPIIILEHDIKDDENFDENGIFRNSWVIDLDGWGYLSVVIRDENGVLTGMVYKVPEEIVRELRRN